MALYDLVAPYVASAAAQTSPGEQRCKPIVHVFKALWMPLTQQISNQKTVNCCAIRSSKLRVLWINALQKGSFTYDDVLSYARGIKPNLAKLITLASSTQVGHWYKVLENWKADAWKDWENTYALSNSIYVARQNNIIFSVLVQFMGEKAINDRLILLETTDFTATPDAMMDAFIRIISDRALGKVFYNDYRLMDFELLGGGGRKAIEAEAAKRGLKAMLPPVVPYQQY